MTLLQFIGSVIGGVLGYTLAASIHQYLKWRRERRLHGEPLTFK